jgi:hypothetical protein
MLCPPQKRVRRIFSPLLRAALTAVSLFSTVAVAIGIVLTHKNDTKTR